MLYFTHIQEFPNFLVSIIIPVLIKRACFYSKIYHVAIQMGLHLTFSLEGLCWRPVIYISIIKVNVSSNKIYL